MQMPPERTSMVEEDACGASSVLLGIHRIPTFLVNVPVPINRGSSMKFFKPSLLALGIISLLATAPAYALNARSFVKSTGLDSNPCTLAAPCRTFQQAVNSTSPKGEVDVLDSAGYGAFTISNPIVIINDVGLAGVQAGAGVGITINTTGAVGLKGLTIEGIGTGSIGIQYTAAGKLEVQDCLITGFTTAGIAYQPNGTSSILVTNTKIEGNSGIGINVEPTSLSSSDIVQATLLGDASFNQTGIQVIGDGLNITAVILAVIQNGTISNNQTGVNVRSSGAVTNVFVRNEIVQGNSTGLSLSGTAPNGLSLTLGANTIAANLTPITATGGTLKSFNDNYAVDNKNALPSATPINKF